MGIWWREGVPRIFYSARDLITSEGTRKLDSGLPQRIAVQHFVYTQRGAEPLVVSGHGCKVVYDLWQGLNALGLGDYGASEITDVVSCPGTDSCKLGITSSMGLNQAIQERLESVVFDIEEVARGAHGAFTAIANRQGLSFNLTVAAEARGGYRGDRTSGL